MEKTRLEVEQQCVGKRLDVFVCEHMDISRSHIKNLIDSGNITINDKVKKSGEKLKLGDIVEIVELPPVVLDATPENLPIDIVYEDNDLLVINKQQGMVVHPANGNYEGTLVNALLYHIENLSTINGVIRPGIVHRLDKDTSGLLLVAKNDVAHKSLAKQIEEKSCHRHYIALVNGNLQKDSGRVETYIGRNPKDRKQMAVVDENNGKKAITNYFVLKRYIKYTLVEFVLETGRTHQIRVHSKHLSHPIVGDLTYGKASKEFKTNGQLLHAYKIEFSHPTTNKRLCFEIPLPTYFSQVVEKLDRQKQKY